eukprot:1136242-Pelagomonas_calceolata.AAC.1
MSNLCHASICAFVPISFVPMEQLEPYGRVKSISAFGNDDTFRSGHQFLTASDALECHCVLIITCASTLKRGPAPPWNTPQISFLGATCASFLACKYFAQRLAGGVSPKFPGEQQENRNLQ